MADMMEQAPLDGGQVESTPEVSGPASIDAVREQAQQSIGGQPAAPQPAAPPSSFFEFEAGGKKVSFSSREEASKAFKDGYLMRADYTRKTQEHAEAVRKFNEDRDSQMKQLQQLQQKFDGYRTFLNQNPHVAQQLEKLKNQPLTPADQSKVAQSYIQESLEPVQKELQELRQWRSEQEAARQRDQVFSKLSEEMEGFSREDVEALMNEFDPRNMEDVYRLLHYAARGKKPPASPGNEVFLAQRQKEKTQARTVPSPGQVNQAPPRFGSIDEARAAALASLKS